MVTGRDALGLSGGIDSPTIAAFAAPRHLEVSGRPLQAVSAVFPHLPAVDEREYIEQVTERLDLPLDAYVPRARPLDDVERWVDLLDGPIDSMSIRRWPSPTAARAVTRPHDDDGRAGGVRLRGGSARAGALRAPRARAGGRILAGRIPSPRAQLAAHLRGLAPSLTPAFVAGRYTRLRHREVRLLPPWIDPREVRGLGYRPDLERPARRRWLDYQVDPLLGPTSSLDANDLCAAACGVHVRFPLADLDIWEHFLALRADVRFRSHAQGVRAAGHAGTRARRDPRSARQDGFQRPR